MSVLAVNRADSILSARKVVRPIARILIAVLINPVCLMSAAVKKLLNIVSATHEVATSITPRRSQKRTEINTTATYRTGTAMSRLVAVSAAKMPAASTTVTMGRITERLCPGTRSIMDLQAMVLC